MKEVVCNEFKTNYIYHAGKNNYSRNYHRALIALYLHLQPDDMRGLKPPLCNNDQQTCPWVYPGSSYMSDDTIINKQAADGMDCDTPERNTKRPRS